MRRPDGLRLLRWYPRAWRDRYGEELTALMEDGLDGRRPGVRLRLSITWAGLRERGHQEHLLGNTAPAADRARVGSVVVLAAWSAFVLAGSSFAKLSEDFRIAVPARSRALSTAAFDTVFVLAFVGGFLVLCGIAIALPAFVRLMRIGGWSAIRRPLLWAAVATVAAGVAIVVTVAVAHTLTPAQRNGDLLYHPVVWYYVVAFVVTALLVSIAIALWTVAAVAATRRMTLPRAVLSGEAVLATAVMSAMALMTVATAAWWVVVASSAPWFLQGVRPGAPVSRFDPNLAATMLLMVVATSVAAYGTRRVAQSWGELRRSSAE
jgi:hypothetical protein